MALLALALAKSDIRSSLKSLAASFAQLKIVGPIIGIACYIACLCFLAQRVDLWTISLLKETIIWFVISGLVLFGSFTEVMRGRNLLRRTALLTLVATVMLEFFMNLFVMPIWAELTLQPFVAVVAMTLVVAERKPEYESVKRVLNGLLGLTGLVIAGFVVWQVTTRWDDINKLDALRELVLPVWLTVALTPMIYFIAVLAAYELAFLRINFTKHDRSNRRRAKLALLSTFFKHIQPIAAFGGQWASDVTSAESMAVARQRVRAYRDSAAS